MIDVIAAAQDRVFSPNYRNRTWLASEMTTLLNSQAWSVLGGLALHAALAAAPLTGDLAQHLATAAALPALTDGPLAVELAAHIAAATAPGSDLQATALRLAGAIHRI